MGSKTGSPWPVTILAYMKWLLPNGSERVLLVVSTYSTLLAIIDQTSTKEATKDSDNETIFDINDEITNVTVNGISHAVLWNCRDLSITKSFYQRFYLAVIICLFVYVAVFMTRLPKKFNMFGCIQLLSDIFLRIALIFILTSYDIDPWACFSGPANITYDESDQMVWLTYSQDNLRYQKGGPILSIIIGIVGCVIGALGQICIDTNENESKYEVTFKKSNTSDLELTSIKKGTEQIGEEEVLKLQLDTENYVKVVAL